ncbi:MAG TPA: DUF6263 family protein [Chitinophagaceae bacterium]
MKKIFLIGAIAVSTACMGQKVSNKLTFQKGAKYEITTIVDNNNTMEMMGQSMDMKMNMTTTRTLDIENVDKNVATIESKVKRMQFNFEGMGQAQKFDSENEADMKGEGGKMAEKALKNKYSMQVDATGKILAVTPDDDNPNKADAAPSGTMGGPMDGMMEGFDLPKTGTRLDLSILPAGEVSKGSTWTDTTSANKDEKRKANYTVTGITDSEVQIEYSEQVDANTVQQNMGMEVNIERKDQSTGKITLDRKTGLLKQQVVTTKTEATAEMMGQRMPMNATTTKTITVRAM